MLRLYPSNKTESLAAVMGALMRAQPLQNPFARELVLIQSQGMGIWLQQQLSESIGIASMIDTQMPASFVWKLSETLMPGQGVSERFDKASMRWEIFRTLPHCMQDEAFAPLQAYVAALGEQHQGGHESPHLEDVQRFRLSEAIADSFDAYQNYRGDWIEAWEQDQLLLQKAGAGSAADLVEQERWQSELWRQLYPDQSFPERQHRPRQLQKLQALLESGEFDRTLLPERLFIFGLSALPPQWLPVFLLLGRYTDIHFLVPNPCRYYWGDIQNPIQSLRYQQSLLEKGIGTDTDNDSFLEGNALLSSWGRLGRDYLSLLYCYDETHGFEEFSSSLFESWLDDSETGTALQFVQEGVLELNSLQREVDPADNSLRFASCHSRLREVEALKDYLADALEQDPDLELRDILVMMPDVQLYAPLIQAVFSKGVLSASGGMQELPFAISDQSVAYDQSLVDALLNILSVSQSRVLASEVMDWLNVEAIRQRFGIEKEDLELVHGWLDTLNIRWGLSGEHRAQALKEASGSLALSQNLSQSDRAMHSDSNTWLRLAQRMLSGYLAGGDRPRQWQGQAVLPAAPEGQEAQQLLGKLLRFLDVIEQSHSLLQGRRSGPEWIDVLYQLWHCWFDHETVPEAFANLFDKIARDLRAQFRAACFQDEVDFQVIASAIGSALEQDRVSQRFLAGRINFCTLMPMRSIPFRQVCLLGMNDGDYPRPRIPSGFDLMQMAPARLGDRSAREDDRYLFLEALMSVRKRLYISYCGRSAQDNSERFPSVLVSELQAWCRDHFVMKRQEGQEIAEDIVAIWTAQHRLQSFHPDYYQGPNAPATYAQQWFDLYRANSNPSPAPGMSGHDYAPEPDEDMSTIRLSALADMMVQPLRYYYRQHMQLQEPGLAASLSDEEPFALDGLQRHQLKTSLLAEERLGRADPDTARREVLARWRLMDRLPASPLDRLELDWAETELHTLREQLAGLGALKSAELTLSMDGIEVTGEVLLDQSGAVFLHLGKTPEKPFFGYWVYHVFLNVWRDSAQGRLQYPGLTGNSSILCAEQRLTLPRLDPPEALAYARALIQQSKALREAPAYFLPRTAYASLFGSASVRKSAYLGVQTPRYTKAGECEDFYYRRALRYSGHQPEMAEDGIPDFSAIPVYTQVAAHADQIREADA